MKKLILIDSHALIHRAFHALPPMTSPKGIMTNAVYGFTSVLLKTIKDIKPDYIAAAFDLAGPTFRHEEFAEYKAHRVKAPDELYAQIPLVRRILESFGIPIFEKAGFEADDIIGSLAEKSKREKEVQTIIMTGDLDTLQLVVGNKVVVLTLKKGMSDTILYDEKAVKERFDLSPEQMPDYKGLKGDPSDNIPGVTGVGDKTAQTILKEYETIENLYKEIKSPTTKKDKDNKKHSLSEKLIQKLLENKDQAFFSKKLATIIRDVPVDFSLKKTAWRDHLNKAGVDDMLQELGFASLIRRVDESLNGSETEKVQQTAITFGPSSSKVSEISKSNIPTGTPAAISLVTDESGNKIEGLSLTNDPDSAMYLPISNGDIPLGVSGLNPLIGHDLKNFLRGLIRAGKSLPEKVADTRIAAWLLQPDTKRYELDWIYQSALNSRPESDPRAKSISVWRLYGKLRKEMESADLVKVFEEIEMPLLPVLARMEERGIAIDEKELSDLSKLVNKELTDREGKIYKQAGGEFNINSPQQLGEILFEKLNLKGRVRKTGGGALSTAAPELEKLREEHPIIDLVLEYRELQKLKTTYIEPFPILIDKRDGRLHTTYNQTGAGTGRLSSQDPNLQNIPTRTELGQQFRKAFIAAPGHKLVAFDYSQLELRIMAHLAQDKKMMAAFRNGEDIHTRTAVEIFKVDPKDVTKDMRRQSKVLNFGIIYGMGSLGFARAAGVSRNQAKEFIERYFAEFSGVANYIERVKKEVARTGYAKTIFGRRRPLPDIHSTTPQFRAQAERMAVNHPAQGTEADLIKLAMVRVDEWIRKEDLEKDVRMLLQVHDELVFEISEKLTKEVTPKIRKIMEDAYKFDVPLIVDAKEGINWAEMKKI
ncbi:MAG: DNA polymerase I [Patescibacteria group bacterium]